MQSCDVETQTETIKLTDFLDEWGDVLKAQVLKEMKPVYSQASEDEWDMQAREKLKTLRRTPFPGQITKGILPIARSFYVEDKKAGFLNGVMGSGKTFMGLAVAHLLPKTNKRILIQCPGHLVKKWIREAENTISGCTCVNLNGKEMGVLLESKIAPAKPKGTEIWVIGKERSKLHFQRIPRRITINGDRCCPVCGQHLLEDFEGCPNCKARLWVADNKKVRRYAKAEFIKRYFPKDFFDLLLLDEVHELKGGGTAQGQAMSCLISRSKKVLSMTGTVMGGYSKDLFYLLWRMFPRWMHESGFEYGRTVQFAERFGVIEKTYDSKDLQSSLNAASIGRRIAGRCRVTEKPGVSPLLLPELLLERSAFVRLEDISDNLPSYEEIVVSVDMALEQKEAYRVLETTLMDETRTALARGDMRLLGKMLQSLLGYVDGCRIEEKIILEDHGTQRLVGSAPALNIDLLPKEERLLEILATEKHQGRKVAIFLEHTGTRDLIPILQKKIIQRGFSPLILRSDTVQTENREEWLKKQLDTDEYNCLLCNPNLVKTGLDLLEFPTIVFFQCGYSVFTLRQASRRSWRIGQDQPVKVFFMSYSQSMQDKALSLLAQKMETSLAVEGVLSEQGLAAMSSSENSIFVEMAKALTGTGEKIENVKEAWTRYRQQELFANLNLDEAEDVTVTTTTTITTATGTATISHEYVIRGRVYIRNQTATAYVDRHRFDFMEGSVYWAGKKVGWYDRKGVGEINGKPIRIFRPREQADFVLAEVRQRQVAA
ncbi:MAG: DEAD/DEAH box helicase [Puia sp.]|nr:DEAD/DEAH box helicase [Puia sp.]